MSIIMRFPHKLTRKDVQTDCNMYIFMCLEFMGHFQKKLGQMPGL